MNEDKIKGTIDDAAGHVKRKVGEWTGDTGKQVEGAAQQLKGKAEKAVGNLRDALKPGVRDVTIDRDTEETVRDHK